MTELDILLIILGAIRLIILDIPVLIVFLIELRNVIKILNNQKNSGSSFKNDVKHKIAVSLLVILITFTLLMYIDRVLINDILMRVFFLWKDNG